MSELREPSYSHEFATITNGIASVGGLQMAKLCVKWISKFCLRRTIANILKNNYLRVHGHCLSSSEHEDEEESQHESHESSEQLLAFKTQEQMHK